MISCNVQSSLQVQDTACSLLTSAQWQTAPGNCRLRIKNYNPAQFLGACPACAASGLPDWQGQFAQFCNLAASELYSPGPGVSIGGKAFQAPVCVSSNFGVLAGQWVFQVACDNGGGGLVVWSGFGPATAAGPLGTYNFAVGCLGAPATLVIEAYSL